MPALFVSFMRTAVPFVVGWLLTLAVRAGIEIDSATVTGAVTVGLGVAYYFVFRLLEWLGERLPGTALQTVAGVLLGWARPPSYPKWQALEPVDSTPHTGQTGNG
ncbi:hypothetical protein ACGFWE_14010 [Streptomyces sp. NPDC048523]|uniref:hypothetical protein n=1 Tax=Streptomyces sp. NPDC048523 TaxID=3365567 RepID=UPI00371EA6C1